MKKFILYLAVLFLFLRLPSLFEPYWYGDEGIYLTLGQAIRQGEVLYRQIHDNKPPTLYYLAALSQTVFGFRLLLLLWMLPTIIVFYRFSQKFLNLYLSLFSAFIFLILSSIPLIEGHLANSEIFMLLPTLVSLLLFLQAKKSSDYFLSGLALGFSFSFKFPALAEYFFLCFFLIAFNPPKFKKFLVNVSLLAFGFLLPILLLAVYFYFQGIIKEFLFAGLLQNFSYLSSWTTGTHSGSAAPGGLISRLFILLLSYALIYYLYHRQILNRSLAFLFGLFFSSLFGSLLSSRPYPHYLIQILPSFSVLLLVLFSTYSGQIKSLVLLVFFILLLAIFKYKFYFYPVFSYYSNFYSYALGLKSQNAYRQFFGSQVNDIYKISEFIRARTSPGEKIFIWADHPYIYALSQRLPLGRFTVAYHIVDFQKYDETINTLKTYLPCYIIYSSMPGRPFLALDRLLARYYFVVEQFGPNLIYQLR